MTDLDDILELMERNGGRWYGGEAVTQLAHALQAAALAERDGASEALVAAALLHDVGHLAAKRDMTVDDDADDRHEAIGAGLLARVFPPEVAEPVRLHVPAKRWLCTEEPGYFATLSVASVHSLKLQGGPFDAAGAQAFAALPFAADAIRLRRWDDLAKDPAAKTRTLAEYLPLLRGLARPS